MSTREQLIRARMGMLALSDELKNIAKACNSRVHLTYSLAPGTGLRLAEIVGLNLGDVYVPDVRPRNRLSACHALKRTAVTNVYRASRDLFLAQRFARHVSPLTTTVDTHPSD